MYPCDIFECSDGFVACMNATAVGRDFGTAMAILLGRPELADDPLIADSKQRVIRWQEFDALITPWFREHTVAAAMDRAAEVGIDLSPVLTVEELLDDKHLRARAFFRRLTDGQVTMGAPFRMSRTPLRLALPPQLGEDNEAVLGISAEQNSVLWQD
jgi:crotonobetainyl-CoA:carnitine CoA-transferase CaiB-like acyl-CoA transferase